MERKSNKVVVSPKSTPQTKSGKIAPGKETKQLAKPYTPVNPPKQAQKK